MILEKLFISVGSRLGFVGPEFTWCNMQEGDSKVLLRLDRALATLEWIDHYKNVKSAPFGRIHI